MSGLEIIGLLLGVTGPLEQAISVVERLKQRFESYKTNNEVVNNISQLLIKHKADLKQLSKQLENFKSYIPDENQQFIHSTLQYVKQVIQDAFKSLQQVDTSINKSTIKRFMKATSVARKCEEVLQQLEKAHNELKDINALVINISTNLSITTEQATQNQKNINAEIHKLLNHINTLSRRQSPPQDQYMYQNQSLSYSPVAKFNFDDTDSHRNPLNIESTIKCALLHSTESDPTILAIHGQAGVGKTTTLSALTHQNDLKQHFVDGTYCVKFGANAGYKMVIQEIARIVKASGGHDTSEKIKKCDNVQLAVEMGCDWFRDKQVLFAIDDVWHMNGNGIELIRDLSKLVLSGRNAAMVYTTRDANVALQGRVFKLSRREPMSIESRRILLRHARCGEGVQYDEKTEEAIKHLLAICAGLPVAHGVVGKTVAEYSLSCARGMEEAWEWYSRTHESIVASVGDEYGSLNSTFTTALRVLEKEEENMQTDTKIETAKTNKGNDDNDTERFSYLYSERHRGLCVLEKQQRAPLSLLGCLWSIEDKREVRKVCDRFVRVGLAEWNNEKTSNDEIIECLSMHDLLHDFVIKEAKKNGEIEAWHDRIIAKCSSKYNVRMNDNHGCREWWKMVEDNDEGYLYFVRNLCRHMKSSTLYSKELLSLITTPLWIVIQVAINGINQYDEDVKHAHEALEHQEDKRRSMGSNSKKSNFEAGYELSGKDLSLVHQATRLSVPYLEKNPKEVWFQLYGRLMEQANRSVPLKNYLLYIEQNAPKPWVKPLVPCLTNVGTNTTPIGTNVWCMAVLSGEKEVVCGCINGNIIVLNLEESCIKKCWSAHANIISDMKLSDNGRYLISGSYNSVKIWEVGTWNQIGDTLQEQSLRNKAVSIGNDGKIAFITDTDGNVHMWNVENGKELENEFSTADRSADFVAVVDDRELLIACTLEKIFIWKLDYGKALNDRKGFLWSRFFERTSVTVIHVETEIRSIAVSRDGSLLATGDEYGRIRVWDTTSMNQISDIFVKREYDYEITCVAFSEDGRLLVYGSSDGSIFVADIKRREIIYQAIFCCPGRLRGVEFINGGDDIVSCSVDGTVKVWSLEDLQSYASADVQRSKICHGFAPTPDGLQFVTAHGDGRLRVWESTTGRLKRESTKIHQSCINTLAISPDEKRIFCGSDDGSILICDKNTLQLIDCMYGHESWIGAIDITPDGNYLVTVSNDKTIRIWDAAKCDGSHIIIYENNQPLQVFVSDDGKRIIARCWNDYLKVWDIESKRCIHEQNISHGSITRRDAMVLAGEIDKKKWDKMSRAFCHEFKKEIKYDSCDDSVILGTIESMVLRWMYDPRHQVMCIVTKDNKFLLLRILTPR